MRKRTAIVGAALLALGAGLAAIVDGRPTVPPPTTPRSETAVQARALYKRLHAFKVSPAQEPTIAVPQAELDAALRVAGRVLPGLRARGRIGAEAIALDASLPLPGPFWVNATGKIVPAPAGFRLADLRVGALPLPPETTLWLGTKLGDLLLGDAAVTRVRAALAPMALRAGEARLSLAMPFEARAALGGRVEAALRRVAVPFDTAPMERLLDRMAAAERDGTLRDGGSLLGWLRFALREAPDGGTAILALAVACGDPAISQVLGWRADRHPVACGRVMLDDRFDLRQHFVISAGLEVTTRLGSAVAVGELKELHDSRRGGSGFSFDDLAANRAGIAFARRVMEANAAERAALAERLTRESVVLPTVDDLDSGLSAAHFRARYGDIDSEAYAEVVVEIDRRIAALPLYAGGEG
jgi:hypothetical protein